MKEKKVSEIKPTDMLAVVRSKDGDCVLGEAMCFSRKIEGC